MQLKESSSSQNWMRPVIIGIVFVLIFLAIAGLKFNIFNAPAKKAHAAANPAAVKVIFGKVNLEIANNQIETKLDMRYLPNKPLVFHIHLGSATGPILYMAAMSTDGNGRLIANNVTLTPTALAPKPQGTLTFPNNWVFNFHDTTIPHAAGTDPVAIGHAPVADIGNNGRTAKATDFTL